MRRILVTRTPWRAPAGRGTLIVNTVANVRWLDAGAPSLSARTSPVSDASKRYTEREFSLILSKAAELSGSSNAVGRIEDGLALTEITSIAAEAGLDADSIARAARL